MGIFYEIDMRRALFRFFKRRATTSETLYIGTVLTYTYFRPTSTFAQEGRAKQICRLDESFEKVRKISFLEKFHVQL